MIPVDARHPHLRAARGGIRLRRRPLAARPSWNDHFQRVPPDAPAHGEYRLGRALPGRPAVPAPALQRPGDRRARPPPPHRRGGRTRQIEPPARTDCVGLREGGADPDGTSSSRCARASAPATGAHRLARGPRLLQAAVRGGARAAADHLRGAPARASSRARASRPTSRSRRPATDRLPRRNDPPPSHRPSRRLRRSRWAPRLWHQGRGSRPRPRGHRHRPQRPRLQRLHHAAAQPEGRRGPRLLQRSRGSEECERQAGHRDSAGAHREERSQRCPTNLYGVFIQVCNETPTARPSPRASRASRGPRVPRRLRDRGRPGQQVRADRAARDQRLRLPVAAAQEGRLHPGVRLGRIDGPTAGALLVFRIPVAATENRPLELAVSIGGETQEVRARYLGTADRLVQNGASGLGLGDHFRPACRTSFAAGAAVSPPAPAFTNSTPTASFGVLIGA